MAGFHTLKSIADEYGYEKRTVQGWYAKAKSQLGEIGVIENGQRVFTDSERDYLIQFARAPKQTKVEAVETEVIDLGEMPESVSLSRFQPQAGIQLADPKALLGSVTGFLSTIEESMLSDLSQRKLALEEAVELQVDLENRLSQFELTARLYEKGVKSVATQQQTVAQNIQQTVEQIKAMGKGGNQAA